MKKIIFLSILMLTFINTPVFPKNDLYEKIDLFGEVLENIKKDYVDDVNQAEMMDSACLLYTSPSPRDTIRSRMPSSA